MDNKEKLIHQLFVGMIVDILGFEKTYEILKEATKAFDNIDNTQK